jgi:hypothetical protein
MLLSEESGDGAGKFRERYRLVEHCGSGNLPQFGVAGAGKSGHE